MISKYVTDADGGVWEYRLVSSVLERRKVSSSVWLQVPSLAFQTMTPGELRHIANVIENAAATTPTN